MKDKYLNWAKEVIEAEQSGLESLKSNIDSQFSKAIEVILSSNGRVIITGIGKSGLIGRKISATLSSTGTKSLFMHPAEAYHGDLGMIDQNDVIIMISNSGETEEVIKLLPFLKDNGNQTISITNNPNSTLSKNTNIQLYLGITEEVCPLNLAPTTSTTATLTLGDALSISLMRAKGFKRENFARLHPGGSLGRKLLTTVQDIMQQENLPLITENDSFIDTLSSISHSKLGCAFVTNEKSELLGIITDGDVRRAFSEHRSDINTKKAADLMTKTPLVISKTEKIIEAERVMTEKKITVLPVVENGTIVGAIQLYDF